jgi:hypothetical protein
MPDTSITVSNCRIEKHPRAFVVPPITAITHVSGNTVTWHNKTGATVRLWIPNGAAVFDPAHSHPALPATKFSNPIDIPKGRRQRFTIKRHPTHGYYKYTVYCASVNGHAQGNSEPIFKVP